MSIPADPRRCICKTGYEYPFGSTKNVFEGAIVEREYTKMLRGEINAYENMQCRPVDQQLEPRYYTSDSARMVPVCPLLSLAFVFRVFK
jgi:hypothetical protein